MKILFNFKAEFQGLVERGEKVQTIRQNRRDGKRPAPGDTACLYAGLRTRKTRLLREATVTRCRAVRIDFGDDSLVIDGAKLTWDEKIEFARADGFPSWNAMRKFFADQYGTHAPFDGFCVEWAK